MYNLREFSRKLRNLGYTPQESERIIEILDECREPSYSPD